jgi:hypothetical protein
MGYGPIPSQGGAHTVGSTAQTIEAATGISVPAGANRAEGYVRTASVVKGGGGFTPTATLGTQANVGDMIILRSKEEIDLATFIRQASTNAAIDWDFFTGKP